MRHVAPSRASGSRSADSRILRATLDLQRIGERERAPPQGRDEPREHPLGDVEVGLAGDRVEAAVALEVRLVGEVPRAEGAERGGGHPRGVAEREDGLRKRPERRAPVEFEEVSLVQLGARACEVSTRRREVLGGELVAHHARVSEGRERGSHEGPPAARRLDHGGRRDTARAQEPRHTQRQRVGGLPVAVFDPAGRSLGHAHGLTPPLPREQSQSPYRSLYKRRILSF